MCPFADLGERVVTEDVLNCGGGHPGLLWNANPHLQRGRPCGLILLPAGVHTACEMGGQD